MTGRTLSQTILVMFLWAVCYPLLATGIQFAPHLTFATLRAALAGFVLTAAAIALRRPLPRGTRTWLVIGAIGLGATSLGYLGMFHAAEFVSPGIATVIANTQPLLAAALAASMLNERLGRLGLLGLALGFAGIVLIASPHVVARWQAAYLIGIGYILLAALGITVSNVLIKRISGEVDALMVVGLQLMIGSLPLAAGAWALEDPGRVVWSVEFVGALLSLSLLGSALVYWLWFRVLEEAPLNRANAFSFLIPIFGLTMGALFYGEVPGWPERAGIALAVVGVALVGRDQPQPALARTPRA